MHSLNMHSLLCKTCVTKYQNKKNPYTCVNHYNESCHIYHKNRKCKHVFKIDLTEPGQDKERKGHIYIKN